MNKLQSKPFCLNPDWNIRVPGKWILAGEHSVLRGSAALVFPLSSCYLELSYYKSHQPLIVTVEGDHQQILEDIIWNVIKNSLQELKQNQNNLVGHLHFTSCIQFGAGMGASATLAVSITRFFSYLGWIPSDQVFNFAKSIEDHFHGESSGVDVAVALHQKPLVFEKNKPLHFLQWPKWPRLYLSYSGLRGVTKECVHQVKTLLVDNPDLGLQIDEQMKSVVQYFIHKMEDPKKFEMSDDEWILQLEKAHQCFVQWGLVPNVVQQHIQDLKNHGARAVKLTGSGQGGFVLSLWLKEPEDLQWAKKLIPII